MPRIASLVFPIAIAMSLPGASPATAPVPVEPERGPASIDEARLDDDALTLAVRGHLDVAVSLRLDWDGPWLQVALSPLGAEVVPTRSAGSTARLGAEIRTRLEGSTARIEIPLLRPHTECVVERDPGRLRVRFLDPDG